MTEKEFNEWLDRRRGRTVALVLMIGIAANAIFILGCGVSLLISWLTS